MVYFKIKGELQKKKNVINQRANQYSLNTMNNDFYIFDILDIF